MLKAKDPSSTYCQCCGAKLTWEHPKHSGHFQESSDYVGGDVCRSCLAEQQAVSAAKDADAGNEVTFIPIELFQAPLAVLNEHGLLKEMNDISHPYTGPVPSQYYMPVFRGNMEWRGPLPQDPEVRRTSILEYFFALYNRDDRPNSKTSRSMSVGDVVKFDGQFYLCVVLGFTQVDFRSEEIDGTVASLVMPDGVTLQVSVFRNADYPCVNIDLIQEGGSSEQVCFVEHNPEKAPGKQLYIGVYCSTEEDTVYYDSYVRSTEDFEKNERAKN